jgi:hypothetical protein
LFLIDLILYQFTEFYSGFAEALKKRYKTSSANSEFEIDQSQALSNYKSKKRDEISLAAWVKVQITTNLPFRIPNNFSFTNSPRD